MLSNKDGVTITDMTVRRNFISDLVFKLTLCVDYHYGLVDANFLPAVVKSRYFRLTFILIDSTVLTIY